MLVISIVLPLAAVTTSSTRIALVSIMFSVAPTTETNFSGSCSWAIASDASSTAAAPDMSNFIPVIAVAGFSE